MRNKINNVLDFIVDELAKNKLNLTSQTNNEAVDLSQDKKVLIEFLLTNKNIESTLNQYGLKLKMIESRSEQWFDLSIESDNEFYPISINPTILKRKENDKLNCKWGIYYALTGEKPDFSEDKISWNKLIELLKNNSKENDQDYYFLVINRENSSQVFWNSLKQINLLVTNGQNLPFQCCWFNNQNKVNRNFEEAKTFLIKNLKDSVKTRSKIMKKLKMKISGRWAVTIP